MARLSTVELNDLLKTELHTDHWHLLKRLPEDVDEELAANCLLEILKKNKDWFTRHLRVLPLPVILELNQALCAMLHTTEGRFKAVAVIIVERLRLAAEDEIQEAWKCALQILSSAKPA